MPEKQSPLLPQKPYRYLDATGKIPFSMTNDYIFRIVLQENPYALKGLVCALLHKKRSDIRSIRVLNPIFPGTSVKDKEFRMDLRIRLPDRLLNLEMQIANKDDWPSRSLTYLSREFDRLEHGQGYRETVEVHQIVFLGYTLFPDHPVFYATYRMMDVRDHYLYSDKYTISVVELGQVKLATEEDRHYGIDQWVRFLTAKTWDTRITWCFST